MLAERLNPKIIVAGFNYTFGKKKQGNSETLQRLCQKYGIKTAIIQPVLLGREPVSSTRVRNMITCGNVQDAQLLLGRAYALDGIIVQNKRIGRTIGYPTANIEPDSARVIPADGVYVSMARVNGDIMPACTNIGTNPTVGGTKRTIETHIFDYDDYIYGLPMSVCFVKKSAMSKSLNRWTLLRSRFGLMQELQGHISAADARYAVLKNAFLRSI